MSEAFQSAEEAAGSAFGVQAVQVIAAEFSISNRLSESLIRNDDEPVSQCYYGLLDSAARCNAIEQPQAGRHRALMNVQTTAATIYYIHL
jgi:hypothetical protein